MSFNIFIQRNFSNNKFIVSVTLPMEIIKSTNKMIKLYLANIFIDI